jgi:hypothetical protein
VAAGARISATGTPPAKRRAYSLCDVKLAACESPRPGNQITRTAIPWSGRFEDRQHAFGAVRRPRCDGPPVAFAECLRRTHTQIFSVAISHFTRGGRGCSLGSTVLQAERQPTQSHV